MLFILLTACTTTADGDRFHGGSGRYEAPKWGSDTADTAGDTGSNPDGDPNAPVFTDVTGSWSDYPNIGVVLEVTAQYTDEGDDIEGGNCYVDAYFGGEDANFDTTVGTGDDDGCKAVAGTFVFAIQELDDSKTTVVEFQVSDAAGNVSRLESVEVAGQ
jgi:hypothetical protein